MVLRFDFYPITRVRCEMEGGLDKLSRDKILLLFYLPARVHPTCRKFRLGSLFGGCFDSDLMSSIIWKWVDWSSE